MTDMDHNASAPGREEPAGDQAIPPEDPLKLRILKGVVIVLGILLIAAFVFLMTIIAAKVLGGREKATQMPATPPVLAIARGARIAEMHLSDRRLAVRITAPDGSEEILLFDARSGNLLARIRLAPMP